MQNAKARATRGFERWFDERRAGWPADLKAAGHRALFSLKQLNQPRPEEAPAMLRDCAADIADFRSAYAAFVADKKAA